MAVIVGKFPQFPVRNEACAREAPAATIHFLPGVLPELVGCTTDEEITCVVAAIIDNLCNDEARYT